MERASHFEEEIESVLSWLPKLEETLNNMGPVAADIRSIKIQIEEVKILKLQAVGESYPTVYPLELAQYVCEVYVLTTLNLKACGMCIMKALREDSYKGLWYYLLTHSVICFFSQVNV